LRLQQPPAEQGVGVVGVVAEGGREVVEGLAEVLAADVAPGAVEVGVGLGGVLLQEGVEVGDALVEALQVDQQGAAVGAGLEQFRVDLQGPLEVGQGLRVLVRGRSGPRPGCPGKRAGLPD
jgi:hypothetical protein